MKKYIGVLFFLAGIATGIIFESPITTVLALVIGFTAAVIYLFIRMEAKLKEFVGEGYPKDKIIETSKLYLTPKQHEIFEEIVMKDIKLIVLIGKQGSGKSHLARYIQNNFDSGSFIFESQTEVNDAEMVGCTKFYL